ncbi:Oxidored-FMN domain-containing protein [Mycena indigotica]|uniref:Oxidored-FMN domain-containing protein n=1 Tax=Mycena indigotica TaxID=2126181 RepID=A0A8H6SRL8_9AGAR|nr:Oxidored-FMN domain-containing protein [Mycena indigotica]KAF7304144.1 Oxidored-FMN domain-containing protein [Mycena indigotica]
MPPSTSRLFQPIRVGEMELAHRVVFGPTTRFRASKVHVPLPHVVEYYEQRASTPGTFIVTEANFIAPCAGGNRNAPGIWSDEQISAWKTIVDRVHAKGCFMYLQLWATGRAAEPDVLEEEGGLAYVSASNVQQNDRDRPPRALTTEELNEYLELYAVAASNAVHKAGFDGVDIHGANGYLLNQFFNPKTNDRMDEYGGASIENRARFPLAVVEAVTKAVGQSRTGFRVSPWGTFNDMYFEDPIPTYTYLVTQLRDRFPDLAYLAVVEPRFDGAQDVAFVPEGSSNDFIRAIWDRRPLISGGGSTRATAIQAADDKGDLVAFSRLFISNPDLPFRLLHDIPLTKADRAFFYCPGSVDPKGYTDYPFAYTG